MLVPSRSCHTTVIVPRFSIPSPFSLLPLCSSGDTRTSYSSSYRECEHGMADSSSSFSFFFPFGLSAGTFRAFNPYCTVLVPYYDCDYSYDCCKQTNQSLRSDSVPSVHPSVLSFILSSVHPLLFHTIHTLPRFNASTLLPNTVHTFLLQNTARVRVRSFVLLTWDLPCSSTATIIS